MSDSICTFNKKKLKIYLVSLTFLLFFKGSHAADEVIPGDQKWATALLGAQVEATPVITASGTIYVSVGNQLWAIADQGAKKKLVYQFPGLLMEPIAATLSSNSELLYVTYVNYPERNQLQFVSHLDSFDLAQANSARPIEIVKGVNRRFSAPTVDTAGAIYIESVSASGGWHAFPPKLIKISADKSLKQEADLSGKRVPQSWRQKAGPAVYKIEGLAGGAVNISDFMSTLYEPYLFYISFESRIRRVVRLDSDYQNYYGWGSQLLPGADYSVLAIDNNPDNFASKGTIYLGNSKGNFEAYQGKAEDYGSKNSAGDDKPIGYPGNNYAVSLKWSKHISTNLSDSTPVVAKNGTAYIGDSENGILYAANADTGKFWSRPLSHYNIIQAPAVDNENDIVYVVDENGDLFAVDTRDDERHHPCMWHKSGINATTAPVLAADGTVLVGTAGQQIIAFQGGRLPTA